jgi:hypothetical protein
MAGIAVTETAEQRAERFAELGVDADDVLTSLEQTVVEKLPAQLDRVNVRKGVYLPMPAVLEQLPSADLLLSAAWDLPAVAFTSPGLAGTPVKSKRGQLQATWTCQATVYSRGDDYRSTARDVRLYVAAIRAVAARNSTLAYGGLPGIASRVSWTGEDYDAYTDPTAARTLGAGFVELEVGVDVALDTAPLPDPAGDGAFTVRVVEALVTPHR